MDTVLAKGKKNKRFYINFAVMVLIMVSGFFIPPIEPMTQLGMQAITIFLGLIWGWSCVDFICSSLIGLCLIGFTSYGTVQEVVGEGFAANLFLTVFFTFVLAAYLERIGVLKELATWFLSRKINIGRPWVFSLLLMMASYIMAMFISVTATIIIMWTMFYSICKVIGLQPKSKYVVLEMLGIALAANVGFTIFPFKAMAILVIESINTNLGMSPNAMGWTATSFVLGATSVLVYLFIMKYVFRPDVSLLTSQEDRFAHLRNNKLNSEQKIASIAMVVFLIAVMAPSVMPPCFLKDALKALGIVGCLAATAAFLCLLRKKNGEQFMNFNKDGNSNVNWEVLLLFAATTPCGSVLASSESGVMPWLQATLDPLFGGMDPIVFTIVFVVLFGALTQFMHNMVLAAVAVPIMCQFAIPLGADPLVIGVLLAFVLNIGICTPGGSTPGALAFANPKWITTSQAYRFNSVIFVSYMLIVVLIGYPVASFFMG
ncbi:MAG: SLC13 family permease [Eggerthellaceae bacterium]